MRLQENLQCNLSDRILFYKVVKTVDSLGNLILSRLKSCEIAVRFQMTERIDLCKQLS